MKIIPSEEFTFETYLSGNEIKNKIKNIIEVTKFSLFKKKHVKLFNGYIENNEFKIKKINDCSKSFLLNIFGNIIIGENKTKINIKMKFNNFMIGFYIFLLSIVLLYFIFGVYFTIFCKFNLILIIENILMIIIISFAVMFFVIIIINIAFNNEKKVIKKYIKIILEAI
jgi:hypothetical protein